MYKTDTICAIASAMTNAGIGIIRVSGSDAIEKVDRIYKGKQKLTEVYEQADSWKRTNVYR